ncbi:MAG: ribbon-helix-helix protein, CopG family [Egibacteraceae bacterium]
MVQLTDELLDLLDRRAAQEGVSRSQLIREAIQAFLAEDHEREINRQIVEGYTRMPQGGEYDVDEWGDLGKAVTALTVETLRRLDEEEREAGIEPW